MGLSELPTSQCGPSILLSSPIVDQSLDNAVTNESPDCVPPVSAHLPPSSGDVSTEFSPSIIADSFPATKGFLLEMVLLGYVSFLQRLTMESLTKGNWYLLLTMLVSRGDL